MSDDVFGQTKQSDEKIASGILSDRLARLEREGIIAKVSDPEHNQKNHLRLMQMGIDFCLSFPKRLQRASSKCQLIWEKTGMRK